MTMKPGPELDALVAEKVMGWTAVYLSDGVNTWLDDGVNTGRMISGDYPWSPSTSIADAWEVVEKLGKDGFKLWSQ